MAHTGQVPDTERAHDWRDDAACGPNDTELFFVDGTTRSKLELARAQSICRECPVRPECLRHAIYAREQYGIWGGVSMETYWRRRRGSAAGGRPVAPCGTQSAWERHRKRHEKVDEFCAEAHEEHLAAQRRQAAENRHEAARSVAR